MLSAPLLHATTHVTTGVSTTAGLAAAVGAAPCTLSSQALITFCTATRTECLAEAESSTAPSFSTNLLQCYCNLQTCYDHPEAPCDVEPPARRTRTDTPYTERRRLSARVAGGCIG